MKLYSDFPVRRTFQAVGDLIALALVALGLWVSFAAHDMIAKLAEYGAGVEESGSGFARTMSQIGEELDGIPIIGSGIRSPFDAASSAGASLQKAGRDQQESVLTLATGVAIVVFVIFFLAVLVIWILPRLRRGRRAGKTQAMVTAMPDFDLLALRALSRSSMGDLRRIDPHPVDAWRRGDPAVIHQLAALEARSAGIRLRPRIASEPGATSE